MHITIVNIKIFHCYWGNIVITVLIFSLHVQIYRTSAIIKMPHSFTHCSYVCQSLSFISFFPSPILLDTSVPYSKSKVCNCELFCTSSLPLQTLPSLWTLVKLFAIAMYFFYFSLHIMVICYVYITCIYTMYINMIMFCCNILHWRIRTNLSYWKLYLYFFP